MGYAAHIQRQRERDARFRQAIRGMDKDTDPSFGEAEGVGQGEGFTPAQQAEQWVRQILQFITGQGGEFGGKMLNPMWKDYTLSLAQQLPLYQSLENAVGPGIASDRDIDLGFITEFLGAPGGMGGLVPGQIQSRIGQLLDIIQGGWDTTQEEHPAFGAHLTEYERGREGPINPETNLPWEPTGMAAYSPQAAAQNAIYKQYAGDPEILQKTMALGMRGPFGRSRQKRLADVFRDQAYAKSPVINWADYLRGAMPSLGRLPRLPRTLRPVGAENKGWGSSAGKYPSS